MFYNKPKRKQNYVSEIDQFLQQLNVMPHTKTNARLEEELKYKRIFQLRDHKHVTETVAVDLTLEWE